MQTTTERKSYAELLKDPRWQKRRLQILEAHNWRCEDCGRGDKTLEVHHCHYIKAFRQEPWRYEGDLLMCLCSDCHEFRQEREEAMHVHLAQVMRSVPIKELEERAWDTIYDAIKRKNPHND